jgi:hypothetical protein
MRVIISFYWFNDKRLKVTGIFPDYGAAKWSGGRFVIGAGIDYILIY